MSGFDRSGQGYKPKKNMMDDCDDTTRKVAAPTAGISFAPMSSSSSPQFSTSPAGFDISAYESTQPFKTTASRPQQQQQQQKQPHQPPFCWSLTDVPTLPEFHPLERTAVFVAHTSPLEVSSRISAVMRERSIAATYDDVQAKVRCMSSSGVDFRVRLYRGRGNYQHGIIVEVQRRFGHSMDFYSDTQAILDAAQGLPTAPPPRQAPVVVSDAEDGDEDDDFMSSSSPPRTSGESSLKMISKMLFGHAGNDSHYLALQTLSSLTDPSKMGSTTASCVATELLKPDNQVGAKLVDLIVSKKPNQQDDEMFHLRVMALTSVANALSAVHSRPQQEQATVIPNVFREALRPTLLRELEQANASNLLAAQQAARCLEFLWRGDHNIGQLQAALEVAQAVGQARHAGLEQQAQRTLSRIMSY
ncbi:hypothetical protein ACA910_021745 [Epithemia clementina (nom. ined.)]